VALLAPLLALMAVAQLYSITDPDYWWHERTGRMIAETGTVPRTDPFSFTAAGRWWVNSSWLSDYLLHAVASRFGYAGNVIVFTAITLLTALLVYATCRRRQLGEPASALLTMVWFAVAKPPANVRTQMITVLFVAVVAFGLTAYRQARRGRLWWFPPLLLAWINLHGGWVMGLALLALVILAVVGQRLAGRSAVGAVPLRPLLVAGALGIVACFINPWGWRLVLHPFGYATSSAYGLAAIAEWHSPSFDDPRTLLFGGLLLATLALGLAASPLGPTDVLWALVVVLMALRSMRHIPLCAVVLVPLLGARLQAVAPRLRARLAEVRWRFVLAFWPLAVAGIAVLLATSQELPANIGARPSDVGYPATAVSCIKERNLQGNIANEYGWGGYLIHALYPGRRVFIDGRDMYGGKLIEELTGVMGARPGWQQRLRALDVRLAVVNKDRPLAAAMTESPDWTELCAGPVERLFGRVEESAARPGFPGVRR
jgi:hypothetical protein